MTVRLGQVLDDAGLSGRPGVTARSIRLTGARRVLEADGIEGRGEVPGVAVFGQHRRRARVIGGGTAVGDRRGRLSDVGADAGVVDVPFADGMPVRVADWNVDVDDTSVEERRDGPLPESPPSAGDSRLIAGTAEGKSNLQKLEDLVTSDELWRIVEPVERAHREFVASRVAGCEPAYCVMDIVVLDAASWLYKTFLGAHNNLYKDLKNWQRLVDAVEEAFPDDPGRRLSATPPSRFQHYRARRGFLNGGVLEALRALYESAAVDTALRMGMFDAAAGSFSRPDKRQFMAGDLTWVSARYKRHRSNAFDPRTGRTRRHDPDADYYHHSDGKRSGSPGRGLVFLTGRNPYPNERILFGHGFMPLRGDPAIKGRNDGDVCVDMFLGVLGRHEALDERVHGFVYDGAADSEAVDRLLDAGKHAVVPVRKTSTGNYAAINLGAYDFKTKDGTISRHTAIAIAGTVVVVLPDGDGDDFYVPLDCPQVKPVQRKKSCTIYGVFAMPDLDMVPPPVDRSPRLGGSYVNDARDQSVWAGVAAGPGAKIVPQGVQG